MALEQPLVIGSSPIIAYYGYWPTFHDARMVSVALDGDEKTVVIKHEISHMKREGDDEEYYVATITMQWEEVEYLSLTAGLDTDIDNGFWYWGENWLSEMNIVADGKLIRTEMIAATDRFRGVIVANRVQVIHFKPLGREKEFLGTLTAPKRKIEYPTEDGKPMAETDKHGSVMNYLCEGLRVFFADRSDVYVSSNNFVFWEEGNPKARISPDAYVIFGSTPDLRDSYKAWEEGERLPAVVFEITSRKTQREDTDTKLPLYELVLRTPEYFLFDPTGDYLKPRLQGYRLENGQYVRLELTDGRLHSEQLGLDLVQEGEMLRLYDPAAGAYLPTNLELMRERDAEAQRAALAEAELARLRAELARLRGGA